MAQFNELELMIYNRFAGYLKSISSEGIYTVVQAPDLSLYTQASKSLIVPDILVLKANFPFMAIEIKSYWQDFNKEHYLNRARINFDLLGIDYFVLADAETVRVFDIDHNFNPDVTNFNQLFKLFEKRVQDSEINTGFANIQSALLSAIRQSGLFKQRRSPNEPTLEEFVQDKDFTDYLLYNPNGRFYHFDSLPQLGFTDLEHQFFQELLEPLTDTQVCRYTSLESLYHMIGNGTYRMASNIAMNDRGEIDYVDKYIGVYYTPLNSLTLDEMKELNKNFISSCTNIQKKDDLTMYRLYGEDSKGVCLVFDFHPQRQKNNMQMRKISYGEARNRHAVLDFLKLFISTLSSAYGIRFRFKYLDIWKHFFKSSDYALEEEVRLLYIDETYNPPDRSGWVKSNPDNIISRYVSFKFSNTDFPLTLSAIVLGPNCPDAQLNRRQLEVFLDANGITGVTVENSTIESYRKS